MYRRISLPSKGMDASMLWNRIGFASDVIRASSWTMAWKDSVNDSCLYTDASNKCSPDALTLCCPRRAVKRPAEERKSGTIIRVRLILENRNRTGESQNNKGNDILPAETGMPAPAMTTSFFLRRADMSLPRPLSFSSPRFLRWMYTRFRRCANAAVLRGRPVSPYADLVGRIQRVGRVVVNVAGAQMHVSMCWPPSCPRQFAP